MLAIVKLLFATTLAVGSVLAFYWLRQRSNPGWLKAATVSGMVGKVVAAILIYLIVPELNQKSDATHFYLPQTLFLLDGNIPYLDYHSSYSLLFPVLLAPFVKLWPTAGMIVLLMAGLDNLMLWLYLRRGREQNDTRCWQVAFLYTFSPLVVYWTSLTGYNSVVIAFFALWGLVLAEKGRDVGAGLVAAFGFLFSKLLMVLTWPAIVFFSLRRWGLRAFPLLVMAGVLAGLYLAGLNVLEPIQSEVRQHTSGNIWFLLIAITPSLPETVWWNILPLVVFALAFLPFFWRYLRAVQSRPDQAFDLGMVFMALVCLLFMLVSKKSYTFYLPMLTLFVLDAVSRQSHTLNRAMFPIMFLGAITTIEPHLFQLVGEPLRPLYDNGLYWLLWLINGLVAAAYLYLLGLCNGQLGVRGEAQKSEAYSESLAEELMGPPGLEPGTDRL